MKINILGGGPAGLYFSILMKKADPTHHITVAERDGPNDTFGWGIVFSGETFAFLKEVEASVFSDITSACETWDVVVVGLRDEQIRIGGNQFSGVGRLAFLNILHKHCRKMGVDLRFHTNITSPSQLDEFRQCDLFIAADGANSFVRQTYNPFFCPSVDIRQNKYIWMGTHHVFDGLNMLFRETDHGWFIAHAYRFNKSTSTFIIECSTETWLRCGFADMSEDETCSFLAEVFRKDLDGKPLLSNNFVKWFNFPLVKNKRWYYQNTVLLGDALHTAHFSIGSGTKLALEDAIALARCFEAYPDVEEALPDFQQVRQPVVEKFQNAAYNSLTWLENLDQDLNLEPIAFAYKLMTRSRRVSYRRIQTGDPGFIERFEEWRRQQPPVGKIPARFMDLFEKKSFAHLGTLMPDGSPHVTAVWVDYDGEFILVNSAKGRRKDINMVERPRVAIEIPDPDNPNRFLAVRGTVVDVTEEGAEVHLDKLAVRYLNRETYPDSMRFPGEVRRVYRIRPDRVTVWDPFGG